MFYQMAFYRLIDRKDIVNAFLLPKLGIQKENGRQEDDDKDAAYSNGIDFTETITIGSREKVSAEIKETEAFKDIKLFTVRIPGISLLRRYANYEVANDWFKAIAEFVPNKGKA